MRMLREFFWNVVTGGRWRREIDARVSAEQRQWNATIAEAEIAVSSMCPVGTDMRDIRLAARAFALVAATPDPAFGVLLKLIDVVRSRRDKGAA